MIGVTLATSQETSVSRAYTNFRATKGTIYEKNRCADNVISFLTNLENSENYFFMGMTTNMNATYFGNEEWGFHAVALYQCPDTREYHVLDYDQDRTLPKMGDAHIRLQDYVKSIFSNRCIKFRLELFVEKCNSYQMLFMPQACILRAKDVVGMSEENRTHLIELVMFGPNNEKPLKGVRFANLCQLFHKTTDDLVSKLSQDTVGRKHTNRMKMEEAKKLYYEDLDLHSDGI